MSVFIFPCGAVKYTHMSFMTACGRSEYIDDRRTRSSWAASSVLMTTDSCPKARTETMSPAVDFVEQANEYEKNAPTLVFVRPFRVRLPWFASGNTEEIAKYRERGWSWRGFTTIPAPYNLKSKGCTGSKQEERYICKVSHWMKVRDNRHTSSSSADFLICSQSMPSFQHYLRGLTW